MSAGEANGRMIAMIARADPLDAIRAFFKEHRAEIHEPSVKGWLRMGGYEV